MRSVVAAAATLIAVTAFAACYDNPTSPMRPRPPAPARSMAGPIGTHSITIPPLNDIDTFGSVPDEHTGIYLPDNSTAVIRVTGTITLAANSGYSPGANASGLGGSPIAGQVVPPTGVIRNGVSTLELMVTYHLSGQFFTPSLTPDPGDSTTYSFTYRTTQGGELLVGRSGVHDALSCVTDSYPPGLPPGCNTPSGAVGSYTVPSYKMTGTQTIAADRLDDDVTLTAVTSTGAKGRSVTFTATANPATPGSDGATGWTWTPDSLPGQTVACSYNANPCITNVYESGTMSVTYYVSRINMDRPAKVHVSTVDCPSGDSIVDDPINRSLLTTLWQLSGADSAALPINGRREHGGYSFATQNDPSHVSTFRVSPADINDTPCKNANLPGAYGSLVPLLSAHVHPFSVGDSLPTNCIPSNHRGQSMGYGYGYGGLSGYDWKRMFDEQLPSIAADSDSIYVASPPDSIGWKKDPQFPSDSMPRPLGNWPSKVHTVLRANGTCRIY